MDISSELKSLQLTVRIQGVALTLLVLWIVGGWVFSIPLQPKSRVKVIRNGNTVQIHSMQDRPFLVTHLTVRGGDAESESDKRTAALPQPTASIDSGGIRIEDITKLDWRDITGKPTSPPDSTTRITALMLRPSYIETAD